jgi:aminopeptidase N
LKATYKLSLNVPKDWVALSNTTISSETVDGDVRHVKFAPTEPLSTYLFSFVAGKFTRDTRTRDSRTISAYYRETDPDRIAQLDTIFSQVFDALSWQEKFTGIKYPFAKYDFVILPGFQFGGMEHTGATLYNDRVMFLGNHPTPTEQLNRAKLIAHETSHMWFGDLVTMAWFDDVWTKEVFANYFAAAIAEPIFPDINHTLVRLSSFNASAIEEDRTEGGTAIQQPLDNLQNAGLIYNAIIYDKAPVVMYKIVELMGAEAYRRGIQEYVKKYSYGNATWDDLIECLDAQTDADIKQFSEVWIKEKGMPVIKITPNGKGFDVEQSDKYGRGLVWPQSFAVNAIGADTQKVINVDLSTAKQHYDTDFEIIAAVPNSDGRGYGYFIPDDNTLLYILDNLATIDNEVARMNAVMTIYENYLSYNIADRSRVIDAFLDAVSKENNPLIAAELIGDIVFMCTHTDGELRKSIEQRMNQLSETMPLESARLQMQRQLCYIMTAPEIIAKYQQIWSEKSNALWSDDDYTTAAYELAVRQPALADSILATQRSRITNQDRLKQFDFVSRACTADTTRLDALFAELAKAENRLIEPYAQKLLYYLNHPTRDEYAARYIEPGLEMLSEIQRTGDIFFPAKWTQMLLENHRCDKARAALQHFLDSHPDYPILLKNKILKSAYPLMWDK